MPPRIVYELVSPISHGRSNGRTVEIAAVGRPVTWRDFEPEDRAAGEHWLKECVKAGSIRERDLSREAVSRVGRKGKWLAVEQLGAGGQGEVYRALDAEAADLVGSVKELQKALFDTKTADTTQGWTTIVDKVKGALDAFRVVDLPENQGALKLLHAAQDADEYDKAITRMQSEINAYRSVEHPNMLRLLDERLSEGWLVTEYQPGGTLDRAIGTYRGDALGALLAFAPLVEAVALLHEKGIVHRDIKPANVFRGRDGSLVLGDTGLAFFVGQLDKTRISETLENVGSRDWMPQWAEGVRLEDVKATFDVFSLGKLLWAMVAGKPKLRNWYHRRPEYDLEGQFPGDEGVKHVNVLLDACVVEFEAQLAIKTGGELLARMRDTISKIRKGAQILKRNAERSCLVCGVGSYEMPSSQQDSLVNYRGDVYVCNACGHLQFFVDGTFRQGRSTRRAWQKA